MHITKLRKARNSVVIDIPEQLLHMLGLKVNDTVGISVVSNRLIVESQPRLRYTLAELLAASDYSIPQQTREREWVDAPSIGREIV